MKTQSVPQKNIFVEPRKRLIDWVRKQLIGPPDSMEDGSDIVGVLPTERFPSGALYPISPSGEGIDPAADDGGEDDSLPNGTGETKEEPAVVRRYIPPSSLGFSFFIKGENIRFQILCRAARYERTERDERGRFKNVWTRKSTVSGVHENDEFVNVACPSKDSRQSFEKKLGGNARLDVEWRRFADGWIATISLCNSNEVLNEEQTAGDFIFERAEKTLFEASLRCVIDVGEVGAYPRVDRNLLDREEQEIELQYTRRHVYAIGHGCAAEWKVESGKVIEIYSDMMPAVEVPQMTADTRASGDSVLSLARLSAINDMHAGIQSELNAFVDGYANWVSEQERSITEQSEDDRAAAIRIVGRMLVAVLRMRTGLSLLSKDERVRQAFTLANRAMLDQMRQSDRLHGKPRGDDAYRWRPFQLAFLLTTLESAANPESDFRDTLDLIWFPTGGGKTEAYLGLIAFQIALRRLRYPDTGGGTTVLMRYTLRLLTRDQFIRATRLICALELIRRERNDLGVEAISVGMWVGEATSPNTFQKAAELLERSCITGDKPALVLDHCPWCGDAFSAKRNYDSTEQRFHFLCRNTDCSFGASVSGRLPCNVVDEALYAEPPTMLVATVDKFARLAWEERANAFFGGMRHLPPELIIQDELHLIAGALGSVAGLYEAAIDTVVQSRGLYPKYIASTATIRMASQQVKRLYGRDVAIFPPPGMNCDDSFFARTVPLTQRPGRIYVGYLAPMLNRQACMAPLAATLLLAPNALFGSEQDQRELLDAWWTQMVYHGSLKGVGNSHTAFSSAVRDFMRLLQPRPGNDNRTTPSIAQLTSLQTAEQNADIFARLNRECDVEGCLDAVLATNMISVGLDVGRLGLMIINGQPLTTAEYIQASSRVGRSEVPGLVFANYYRDQARSLSHYESFRPYHDAFYRFVEPTSVTPYTYQARMRALHAALVIVIRHTGKGMLGNENAGDFDPSDALIAKTIDRLKRRCKQSVSENSGDVDAHIDALVAEWRNEVERCRDSRRKLEYQVPDRDTGRDRLLYNHDDRIRGLWATLQSLRNVENSALLKAL
ncbi:MAG: helicase [Betaproteobacteria bacterium]|nr:helicase [Betaproteobacteria bacterium]